MSYFAIFCFYIQVWVVAHENICSRYWLVVNIQAVVVHMLISIPMSSVQIPE